MNQLEKLFDGEKNKKLTENGDLAYKSTGDKLVDILVMTEYYQNHLDEVKIGDSDTEKLFSMFRRDPRYGLGRRDLGRVLMAKSKISAEDVVKAGIFISDMNNFGAINEVYGEYFNEHKPARACVEVARLPKDVMVEIEMIAYIGE